MSSALHYELYEEFISYLWDDQEALKACSLSSRTFINHSQKWLFYRIILRRHIAKASSISSIGGTSSAFHRLLELSPHIAGYVECLQIFDTNVTYHPEDSWLPNDTFLPLFLPLLCNLKAFVLHHVPNWNTLCEKVRRGLQHLIQLPSLVFLDLSTHPTILLTEVSHNLKHLTIRENYDCTSDALLPLDHSGYSPIFLETLFVSETQDSFLIPLTSDPKLQFKTNQLRKLVLEIDTDDALQHRALWPLLRSCRKTLEEFTLMSCVDNIDISATPQYTSVNLSRMTALKVLTLYLRISDDVASDEWDPLWCFNNLLRSASSTFQLEEITLITELYRRSFDDAHHIRYWDDISDILFDTTRCPRLMKLSIHTTDQDYQNGNRGYRDGLEQYFQDSEFRNNPRTGPPSFIALLNASKGMEKLRARPDIEVITTVTEHVDLSSPAPDTRWKNFGFTRIPRS